MSEKEIKELIKTTLQEAGYICMLLGHLVRKNGIAMLSIYII